MSGIIWSPRGRRACESDDSAVISICCAGMEKASLLETLTCAVFPPRQAMDLNMGNLPFLLLFNYGKSSNDVGLIWSNS